MPNRKCTNSTEKTFFSNFAIKKTRSKTSVFPAVVKMLAKMQLCVLNHFHHTIAYPPFFLKACGEYFTSCFTLTNGRDRCISIFLFHSSLFNRGVWINYADLMKRLRLHRSFCISRRFGSDGKESVCWSGIATKLCGIAWIVNLWIFWKVIRKTLFFFQ